jgi:phosphomannomutase
MTLRLASFGIRGFVGESLTPKVIMDFASAFGTFLDGRRVLLGRDTRYSSPMIHACVVSSLLSAGCEVLDLGVVPTPMLQFSVKEHGAAGAVSITGGHNGMGWNALILIGADGAFLEPLGGENVLDCFHAGDFLKQPWDKMGQIKTVEHVADSYFQALEKQLNTEAIRRARFKVLMDPVGGAGCGYLEAFAGRFGCSLVPLNAQPSGYLAREAEPRPRSSSQMASIIKHLKGDAGFVFSSDMGRVSLVTEQGEPASEEYTFAVIANHILDKKAGTVVTNCCTTRTIDDIAALKKVPVVKTRVGQAYVISSLMDEQGVIGGEGNGSVGLPEFSRAFDGMLMMGLVLEAMAEKKSRLSDLLKALPRYHIVKRKLSCESSRAYRALEILQNSYKPGEEGRIDLTDGFRVDWADGWIHARASRTEQIVRVISEAASRATAEQRANDIVRIIEQEI